MKVGIVALLHESNTFLPSATGLEHFRDGMLLTGEPIRQAMADTHHEVGGFFAGLNVAGVEAVPIFFARATPSGTIRDADFRELVSQMLHEIASAGPLDGLLVAPHGATVSELERDADGYWLSQVRALLGDSTPIIGTLDAHANLSPRMVAATNALVAYRTNPHIDQRARGIEAARLMIRTLRGEIRPTQRAAFPPVAINIERQLTDDPQCQALYAKANAQLQRAEVLSNSILLGFPYSDVEELGSACLVVTDDDEQLAQTLANELADHLFTHREEFCGQFTSIDEALEQASRLTGRVCLLDMGDNVGGGSPADGTWLAMALHERGLGPACVCLFDPLIAAQCIQAGLGAQVSVTVGGHTDPALHGPPLSVTARVHGIVDGQWTESEVRHGGIKEFDQGPCVVLRTETDLYLLVNSKRTPPFSLKQLSSAGLNPLSLRLLVAKGVHAPVAAYREVCEHFIRVNTLGCTSADMTTLTYHHRRHPLYPFEDAPR